jgi:type IV pilus assembly protein PilB
LRKRFRIYYIAAVRKLRLQRRIKELLKRSRKKDAVRNALDEFNLEYCPRGNKNSLETSMSAANDNTPLVKRINGLLIDAIEASASDLHFEPYESDYRIRFRIDGLLHEIIKPSIKLAGRLASRIKVMAQMDIAKKRLPQDGRIKLRLSSVRSIEFRVNTLPTLWGEKIVLRILDPLNILLGVDALGFEALQKEQYLRALEKQQGFILVTVPTGSGKTISLYNALSILNTNQRNISAAEDPVEINLPGINQVSVNPRIGLNFASAMRAFLRQDPDIIMVGEVRDLITAEMAIRTAQTGHLVLSTLHTNSAAASITRLRSMGIPAFNLANSLSLIVAQRLARRLCNNRKESVEIPEKVLIEEGFKREKLARARIHRATGCDICRDGYSGRIGFYEVVPISATLSRIIMDDGDAIHLAEQARKEGCLSLRDAVLLKVAQGITSLEEANRLT